MSTNEAVSPDDSTLPDHTETSGETEFDFSSHRATAVESYRGVRGTYADLAVTVAGILGQALDVDQVKVHSIEQRAKDEQSFGDKAARTSDDNVDAPKYDSPLEEIHDLAGCRVITFFLKDVHVVRSLIEREFEVLEIANRSSYLRSEQRPGYESYHFVVLLNEARLAWPEYSRYRGFKVEIQVRTILQHAWAEIEHDIQYKSADALPEEIGRRFTALAGMIEIGDREFQAISDTHNVVLRAAAVSLQAGRLNEIELTADSLKAYADQKLGSDGRVSAWSYDWTARMLKRLGFKNLQQLDNAISDLDSAKLSRIAYGSRQGQLTRLELQVLAALGAERFKAGHPFMTDPVAAEWFAPSVDRRIKAFEEAGVNVGSYSFDASTRDKGAA